STWMVFSKGLFLFLILLAGIWGLFLLIFSPVHSTDTPETAQAKEIISRWSILSHNRKAKVIYATPPHMMILDLKTGQRKIIPNIVVEGGSGRKNRGLTPRPFWAPDGKRFIYRYHNRVYVGNEKGEKKQLKNKLMNTSKETRWSWWRDNQTDWAVGPSQNGNVILVNISNPSITRTVYRGGDVKWWCEITGTGKYVVVDTGSDIYVAPTENHSQRIKISRRQSCRPCAAPDNRVAWLPASHTRYHIFNAVNGHPLGKLLAPPNEGIYRLNWSNHHDFAVHMYGSADNQRMHARRLSTGEFVWIGHGWDPDLWVEAKTQQSGKTGQ
ncbi:MAG: hypothetical protein KAT17_09940, partial [Candidatus Aminicenantes bacterium]|nr:hypothetical protein [Candidatus Aminicenantes bacterium]